MAQITDLNMEFDPETRPYVPWKLIDDFMTDVFKAVGVPEEDARLCSDVLLESDRRVSRATAATVSSRFTSTGSRRGSRSL